MRITIRLIVALLMVVVCFAWAETARSQNRDQPPAQKKATPRPIHITGRVLAVAPDLIFVEAEDGKPWEFKIIDRTIVEVSGHTDVRSLGAGTPVRFSAYLDRRRTGRDELAELTIFAPGADSRLTLQRREDLEAAAAKQGGDGKKLEREGDLGDLVDGQEDQPPAKKRLPAVDKKSPATKSDDSFEHYFVTGRVRSVRKNFMTVLAGPSVAVRVRLAKQAVVKIEADDYKMARRGDEIDVKGYYVYPGKANAHDVLLKLNLEEEDDGIPIRDGRRATTIKKPRRGKPRAADKPLALQPLDRRPLDESEPENGYGSNRRE